MYPLIPDFLKSFLCISKSRKGMGFLVIFVVVILGTLTLVVVANQVFVQQNTSGVRVVTLGDQGYNMVQSALEESVAKVQEEINQPGKEVFDLFRSNDSSFEFSINPEVTKGLKDEISTADFALDSVQAEVLFQKAFTTVPYERFGTIRFYTGADTLVGFGRDVTRTAERYMEFRSNLISVPPPFDTLPLYVKDVKGWIEVEDHNANIEASVKAIKELIPELRQRYITLVDKLREIEVDVEVMGAGVMTKKVDPDSGVDFNQVYNYIKQPALKGTLPTEVVFPLNTAAYSMLNFTDLSVLNLPPIIKLINDDLVPKSEEVVKLDEDLQKEIKAANAKKSDAQAVAEHYKTKVKDLIIKLGPLSAELEDLHIQRLQKYKEFQDLIQWDETGAFTPEFWKLETGLQWQQKAFHWLQEPSVNEKLQEFLTAYRPSNGIVYIQNPSEMLNLVDISIQGKLVIVASGKVTISNLTVVDPSRNLATIISGELMNVSGNVQASLIPLGGFNNSGVNLVGNLILRQIGAPQFQGALTYDGRLESGNGSGNYVYFALGPRQLAGKVKRTH